MTRFMLCCVSVLALVAVAAPAGAEPAAKGKPVVRSAVPPKPAAEDCEARMRKLEASQAEGAERLAEKNEVIELCASQYKRDKTVERLVKACAKYEEQPVVKQQAVAECQLAAYNYANNLRSLKAEYRK